MVNNSPGISLESQVQLSLSAIEDSINSLATEQHEMFELLKDMQSAGLAARNTGTDKTCWPQQTDLPARQMTPEEVESKLKDFDKESRHMHQAGSDLAATRHFSDVAIRAASNPEVGSTSESFCAESFMPTTSGGGELSRVRSNWNQNWPGSVKLRPSIEGLLNESISSAQLLSHSKTRMLMQPCEVRRMNSCIILPASKFRFVLDVIGLCLLAWDLGWTPVQLAWNLGIEGWVFTASMFTSSFWVLDIFINFRTAFYTKKGDLETRPIEIAKKYLRHQFIFDFLIVVCDGASFFVGHFSKGFKLARAVKLIRLVRILRIMKLERFEDFVNALGIGAEIVESIKISLLTCWLAHFVSCAWFAVGTLDTSDTGWHWVHSTWAEDSPSFVESGLGYQYFSSLQWTLSTMVSGTSSIIPLNSAEQIFSCFCIMVGLLMQAFVVSILSSSAVEQKARKRNLTANLSSLEQFCSSHRVQMDLWLIARSQVRASFVRNSNARLGVDQVEGLHKISSKIRMEILYEVFEPHLSSHALFLLWSLVDRLTLWKVTRDCMNLMYVQSGHVIFMAGDVASNMHLLSMGKAKYSQDPESSKVAKVQVTEVQLNKWFCEPALWMEWCHVGTMEATSDECEVQCLSVAADFLRIVEQSKHLMRQMVYAYAVQYHKRVRESVPPLVAWPNDVETHGTTFIQILASMPAPFGGIVSSTAAHCALRLGLVSESQMGLIQDEVRDCRANVVMTKTGSTLSLQRAVSVARIIISRYDERRLMQLCKRADGKLLADVKFPGSKQLASEDIFATLRRVANSLVPVVGNIEIESVKTASEVRVSKKVEINTHYSFFDAHFFAAEPESSSALFVVRQSSAASMEPPPLVRRNNRQDARRSLWNNRSSTDCNGALGDLKEKLFFGSELFIVPVETGEVLVCSWLNQEEIELLTSRSGAELLQDLIASKELAALESRSSILLHESSSQEILHNL